MEWAAAIDSKGREKTVEQNEGDSAVLSGGKPAGNGDLCLSAIGPGDATDESAADFHGADDDRGLPSGNDERGSGRRDLTRYPQAVFPIFPVTTDSGIDAAEVFL